MKNSESHVEMLVVKEEDKCVHAKRVDVVSLRLVKETSMLLYKDSAILKVWKMATTYLRSSLVKGLKF